MKVPQHSCLRGFYENTMQEYECNKVITSSFFVIFINIIITLLIFYSRKRKRETRFQCSKKNVNGKTKSMLVPSCRHIILQVKEREEV
jgi:hypothetical protein